MRPGADRPRCSAHDEATGWFVGGLVAVPLGAILLALAIGLQVDGAARRDALRRRLSLRGGPGDLGLSLRFALDG